MSLAQNIHCLAPSSPGGIARQYRVQFHEVHETTWRLYATFRDRAQAERCASRLEQSGYSSRIVIHAICPAAA